MAFGGPKVDFASCMIMHSDLREDRPLIININKSTGVARGARLWLIRADSISSLVTSQPVYPRKGG